jgi:hypothetical protein
MARSRPKASWRADAGRFSRQGCYTLYQVLACSFAKAKTGFGSDLHSPGMWLMELRTYCKTAVNRRFCLSTKWLRHFVERTPFTDRE